MKKYFYCAIILISGIWISTLYSAPDDSPDIKRVIHNMEQVREEIDELTAIVERRSGEDATGPKRDVKIKLTYKKPDKLISKIEGGREVLINGDKMWIYSPDLEIVEAYNLQDEEKRKATLYEMSWGLTSPIKALLRGSNRSATTLDDGTILVTVIPDQKDAQIKEIRARVDPRTWLISKMVIFRVGQPAVTLRVKEWRINDGLPDSIFEFKLPEGADLFEPLAGPGEVLQ
ncbi:MAG: outer-membrane lipoprotein carrier protein LolA [Candidatus Auribacterota bacterium]|nr:outer-membrane lipoprotein carrier protein LolA [Candidatus Auribacterota bacterium]